MRRLISLLALPMLLVSCGGGGNSSLFATSIAGHWGGPIRQVDCARCSDGNFICIGAGFVVGSLDFDINVEPDEDAGTEQISVAIDGCQYSGTRTEQRTVNLTGQGDCLNTMKISEIDLATMQLRIYRPTPTETEPFSCAINVEGVMSRR